MRRRIRNSLFLNCCIIGNIKKMIILSKIWKNRKVFRSILPTIYFNFHYLPFNQAIKLPILLYKPKFYDLKGTVEINAKGGGKKATN